MTAIRLIHLDGLDQLCLADDLNLTPKAIAQGHVSIEVELAALPEVREIRPDHWVCDVGAFVGDTSITFANMGANVIAFEPQTDAFICATWNTRRLPKVNVINAAVGNGEEVFPDGAAINGNLGTRSLGFGGDKKSLRIDDLNLPRLDFLKIDVEGFEPAVIQGALKTIEKFRPIILVEIYHEMLARYVWTKSNVVNPLLELGYTYRCAIGSEEEPRFDLLFKMP